MSRLWMLGSWLTYSTSRPLRMESRYLPTVSTWTERFRTQGVPKRMKELEYAHVMMVGTGANYALYVIRDTTEEDQEELEEYDVLDQTDIEYTE